MKLSFYSLFFWLLFLVLFSEIASSDATKSYFDEPCKNSQFEKLSSSELITLITEISNIKGENKFDDVSKSLAVESIKNTFKIKNPDAIIQNPEIFKNEVECIDITKFSDGDIMQLYRYLKERSIKKEENPADIFALDETGNRYWLSDKEKTLKNEGYNCKYENMYLELLYSIALSNVNAEIARRDNSSGFWAGTVYVVSSTISLTCQMALRAAKFLIFFA